MNTTTARSDVHRPSAMDPAEYRYVGCSSPPLDERDPGLFEMEWDLFPEAHGDPDALPWAIVEHKSISYTGEGERFVREFTGGCDHCGNQAVRHFAFFQHEPSGEIVAVGQQCAAKLGMDSRSAVEARRRYEKDAARREAQRKGAEFLAAGEQNREAVEFLMSQLEDEAGPGMPFYVFHPDGSKVLHTIRDDFYASVLRRFMDKGELSEKQVAAVLRSKVRQAERAEQRAEQAKDEPDPAPVIEGRIEIAGRLLSTKFVESGYGSTTKMLVLDDRGFKVFGSCPGDIINEAYTAGREAGYTDGGVKQFLHAGFKVRVQFTATVERSKDDETFGYFKRPAKARLIA